MLNCNAFRLAAHAKIAVCFCGNDYSSWLYRSQDSTNWERTFPQPYRNYIIPLPHRCRNPQNSAECQKFSIFSKLKGSSADFRWMAKFLDFLERKESFTWKIIWTANFYIIYNVRNPFIATYLCRTAFLISNAITYTNHWTKTPYKQK